MLTMFSGGLNTLIISSIGGNYIIKPSCKDSNPRTGRARHFQESQDLSRPEVGFESLRLLHVAHHYPIPSCGGLTGLCPNTRTHVAVFFFRADFKNKSIKALGIFMTIASDINFIWSNYLLLRSRADPTPQGDSLESPCLADSTGGVFQPDPYASFAVP